MGYFLPFYPRNSLNNENFKKVKKILEISSFYTSVTKIMIICYTAPEIWHVTHVIIFHFGLFFSLLAPNSPKNQSLKKNEKLWRYHHFTHVYHKLWLDDVWFLRYGAQQKDGQMDGQKKWHIEVGAPPNKQLKSFPT